MRSEADAVSREVEEVDPPLGSVKTSKDEIDDEEGVMGAGDGESIVPLSSFATASGSREFSAEFVDARRSFAEDNFETLLSECSEARDAGASEVASAEDDAVFSLVSVSLRSSAY